MILNSKYEDVRFKLKESRKLLKVSENNLKLLRKQISSQELSINCLKENFKVKLQNMKQSFIHYLLDIEQMKTNLSHIVQLLKQEIKVKYESYFHKLYTKKTSDLHRTIYNEIEQKMKKEKEVSIKSITIVKENQIDHLQQVNNELKLKMTRQCEEYENEINQAKSKLEQVTYELTKELEDCQLAHKKTEVKLIKETETKENLEKRLVKLSSEMERIKKDYENLSKQAKLEKSSRFTDLVAELDRKWSETVGRECARVRSETVNRLDLEYKTKLEELTNKYEKTITNMNKQLEVKNEIIQCEANKMHQPRNPVDQEVEYVDKEISSDVINLLSKTSLENLDQSIQTDELNIKYEQELRQKQNDLEEVKVNYDKLLEEFIHSQSTYEQIQTELQNQLKNERLANEERLNLKEKELEKHFQHELQTMKEHYENIKVKECNEFILAQNILKSKIHELHQRLLGCSCESSKVLKQ
ncbi:serine threonine- kinase TAO1-A, partial [Schistosoma japonicum]